MEGLHRRQYAIVKGKCGRGEEAYNQEAFFF